MRRRGAPWAGALLVGAVALGLAGCKDSFVGKPGIQRPECMDEFCEGDVRPSVDPTKEEVLKIGGRWFVGPKEYFSRGINGAGFEWWDHHALPQRQPRPPEAQALVLAGRAQELSVPIFLGSDHIPPKPRGYKLIEMAEQQGWIAERTAVRPGLDEVRMKHVLGPQGRAIDHVTYLVATDLRGPDGSPPVATCRREHPDDIGGTAFFWKPGVWAGARSNQKHCIDFPELYQEITKILSLLRET